MTSTVTLDLIEPLQDGTIRVWFMKRREDEGGVFEEPHLALMGQGTDVAELVGRINEHLVVMTDRLGNPTPWPTISDEAEVIAALEAAKAS